MKAYLIHSPSTIFGQTDTGCHVAAGEEVIVAVVGLDESDDKIAAFMAAADLRICFPLGNQREWEKIPLPHTREGLSQAMAVALKRRPGEPYVVPASWGQYRIHFGAAPTLEGPTVHLDGANLAYQRGLLAGRA